MDSPSKQLSQWRKEVRRHERRIAIEKLKTIGLFQKGDIKQKEEVRTL